MTEGAALRELGLQPGAGPGEVRDAFRALAQRVHPDVNPSPDAGERFARARLAYETLRNPGRATGEDSPGARASADAQWDEADEVLDAMFGTDPA